MAEVAERRIDGFLFIYFLSGCEQFVRELRESDTPATGNTKLLRCKPYMSHGFSVITGTSRSTWTTTRTPTPTGFSSSRPSTTQAEIFSPLAGRAFH
ncbi:hypothetical protein BDN72DRAFT_905227 [Pluteus cervinus]|uniref:Uncharacterized protein n=1 Tax=Pluteus cervinus TaxID=181527 RepID=A0ACD3A3I8_9AGAR|nr:hypothetical protein BDN72DRAFT_905227 [Pluteus cervinus]